MARVTLSGRIYFDTNIFIYALEGYPAFRPVLTDLFDAPDAIHAATAQFTWCTYFLTNDTLFPTFPGLNRLLLSQL